MSRRPALGFIFVTLCLDILGIGIIVPVLPDLVRELNGGETDSGAFVYGILVALYCLMQFICAPLLGTLSDRVGRRPVILVALFGSGIDYFLLAWAPTLGWFFLGRIICGATAANFSAATAYIADVSPPEKRSANFALVGAAFGAGFTIGPALGGLLGEWYGLRAPFIAAGILTLLSWLYGLFVLPESLKPENVRKFDWKRANPFGMFKGLARSPLILGMALAVFLYNIAHYVYQSVWVLYCGHRYGWSSAQTGYSLAFVGIMAMLMQGYFGRKWLPRLGERRAMIMGLLATGLAMLGYGLVPQGWMVYPIIVFASVGGLASPAMQGLMSRNVGDDEQGWIQGAITGLSSLAGIFAPPLLTAIFAFFIAEERGFEVPGAAFFFSVVVVFVALGVAWRCSMCQKA